MIQLDQLLEIINEKIQEIRNEMNSMKTIKSLDTDLQTIIDKLQFTSDNFENLLSVSEPELEKLYSICGENNIRNLIVYKKFLKNSLDNPNVKFQEQSIERLQKLCSDIKNKFDEYKEKILLDNSKYKKLVAEYDELVRMKRKLKNSFDVTSEDIDLLCKILKDRNYSSDDILNYITFLVYGFMKQIENEDLDNIEDIELEEISLEEMTSLFAEYGYDFSQFKQADQNKMLKKCRVDNVRAILEVLKDNDINLNDKNVSNSILVEKSRQLSELFIHSKANLVLEIIKIAKNEIKLFKNGKIDFALLIERPSIFIEKKRNLERIKEGPGGYGGGYDIIGCHQDFINNVNLIKTKFIEVYGNDQGFDNFFRTYKHKCVFEASYKKTLNVINTFEMYKVHPRHYLRALSSFAANNHADTLDVSLELNCYEYIKDNPSKIVYQPNSQFFTNFAIARLAGMTDGELFNVKERSNTLGQVSNYYIDLRQKHLQKFIDTYNLSFDKFKLEDNFTEKQMIIIDEFERLISNHNNTSLIFATKELNDPKSKTILKYLEDYVDPDNKLIYNIRGIKISRNKVLRLYTILKLNNFEESLDIMLYIITRNSYLTQQQFETIKNEITELENQKEKKL